MNKESKARTLSGLKDGTVSSISTEAITGKQLYETNSKVAEYFGGNASYKDGEWTDPTFTVNVLKEDGSTEQKKYKNVANALEDLSSSFTTVVENNLVQQESSETKDGNGRITIGAKTGGTEINLLNKESKERTLSGLKDGTISATSTEAITGKQLYETNSKVAEYFGGNASYKDGEWTDPTFTVNVLKEDGSTEQKKYKNVANALEGLSSSFTTVVENNLVQQESSETKDGNGRITIGAKTGGTEINLLNKDSKERTLSGLKDGTVSATSTEAITGKQLYETNSKVAQYFGGNASYKDGKWIDPTFTINVLKEDGSTEQKKYKNVADALDGLSGSFTTVVENNLVQQEASEDGNGRIMIGSKVGGTEINLLNKDSKVRTLSGLKDGTLSETSTEAITGKQLYSTNIKVAQYFGGNASYEDGKWIDPTFTINVLKEDGSTEQKKYKNVADALDGLSSSFTTVVENNLVQQEASEDGNGRIMIGSKVGGTEINLLNKDSKARTLSGLNDGMLSETSTEAVTGKQLYNTNTKVAQYFGGEAKYGPDGWTAPTFQIIQFDSDNKTGEQKYKKYNNVASAFDGVNKSMEDLNKRLNNIQGQAGNDGLAWNKDKGAYDASRKGEDGEITNSKLTGVADGEIKKGSSDAVTGGQLWETNQKVNDLENKFNKFENSGGQMTEGAVLYDQDEDGNKTNKITLVGGDASAPVVIDNIGDGKVEKHSKEAINGGQLYEKMEFILDESKKYTDEKIKNAVSEAKEYTDMKFDTLSYNLEGVKQEARQAAAIGLAVSNLRYEDAPGALSIAFSSGVWRSQSAIAFGAGYTSEDGNIRSNVSVTTAGGHWGIGAGISVRLK
ncbi:Surface protein/Bartonella adhesin (fragment) [Bartonella clarridgeiae 73]|uniref:Surface protein/Bartonella adhesin n=1 Tax=Bartonella clarridgeiae (strain CCUG 45776 / CIP 104772 / 73) TaxID=696125 RepID=E6YIW1_BARC7